MGSTPSTPETRPFRVTTEVSALRSTYFHTMTARGSPIASAYWTDARPSTSSTPAETAQVSAPSSTSPSGLPKTGNQLSPLMLWAGSLLLLVGLTMMRGRRRREA